MCASNVFTVALVSIVFCVFLNAKAYAESPPPPGMVLIPGGTYTTAVSEAQANKLAEEAGMHPSHLIEPQNEVTVEPFYLDKFEVTVAEYAAFIAATGHRRPALWGDPEMVEENADLPVTMIDVDDAKAFAEWAGKRLPTEEEWEWAARGADASLFPWGCEWQEGAANVMAAQLYGPAPGGAFATDVTPQGVCDMAGNVSEWTSSRYAHEDGHQPVFAIRGGNWSNLRNVDAARFNRNASSYFFNRFLYVGFRCALDFGSPAPRVLPETEKKAKRVHELVKQQFEPPAEPVGPITVATRVHGPHSIEFTVPGMLRYPIGLQFPEVVLIRDKPPILMHENIPFHWVFNEDKSAIQCDIHMPQRGFEMTSRAEIKDRRVDLTIRFKNLSDETMESVTPMLCLGPAQLEWRIKDPEHMRTAFLTPEGKARALIEARRGPTDRPQFRYARVECPLWPQTATWLKENEPTPASVIGVTTRNEKWTYVKVFEKGMYVSANSEYSCIHSVPTFGDLAPGEESTLRGALFFLNMPATEALNHAWSEFKTTLTGK